MGALPSRQFVQTLRHPWVSFVVRTEPGIGHNLDDEKENKMNNLKSMVSVSALFVAMTAGAATTAHAAKWAYGGEHGPEYWAELSGDYAACAGAEQSPIDLVATHSATTEAIETNWRSFVSEVVNNGHTIQANAPAGNVTLFGGERYELLQLHFHAESEHTADGESFPMEAHFVHRSDSGALMVLGVFLVPGEGNAVLGEIWDAIPYEGASENTARAIDVESLLPDESAVFRYAGSLTTPPCSEIVNWVVYEQPVEVSAQQLAIFEALYPNSNRPIQPTNRRLVLIGD